MSAKEVCRAWSAASRGFRALWRAVSLEVNDTPACDLYAGPAAEGARWMRRYGTLRARVVRHVCACPHRGGGARRASRHLSLPTRLPLLSLVLSLKLDLCGARCARERLMACACTRFGDGYDSECDCSPAERVVGVVRLPRALRQLELDLGHPHLRADLAPLAALTALRLRLEPGPAKARLALPPALRQLGLLLLHYDEDDEVSDVWKEAGLPRGLVGAARLESLWAEWARYDGREDEVNEIWWHPLPTDLSLLDANEHVWCRQLTFLGLSKLEVKELPPTLPPALRTLEFVKLCKPEEHQATLTSPMTALAGLRHLRRLTLPFGTGVPLPPAVAQISSLEALDLTGGAYDDDSELGMHDWNGNADGTLTPPVELARLPRLRHLAIHVEGLNGAEGVLWEMPALETLRLGTEPDFAAVGPGAYFSAEYYQGHIELFGFGHEELFTAREALRVLLCRRPRLRAVYSDDDRLRHYWNLPPLPAPSDSAAAVADIVAHRAWNGAGIDAEPAAVAARASGAPLLPEAEWAAAAGGGRAPWAAWDAAARGAAGAEWAGAKVTRVCCRRTPGQAPPSSDSSDGSSEDSDLQ
jgi:hypothetical protein